MEEAENELQTAINDDGSSLSSSDDSSSDSDAPPHDNPDDELPPVFDGLGKLTIDIPRLSTGSFEPPPPDTPPPLPPLPPNAAWRRPRNTTPAPSPTSHALSLHSPHDSPSSRRKTSSPAECSTQDANAPSDLDGETHSNNTSSQAVPSMRPVPPRRRSTAQWKPKPRASTASYDHIVNPVKECVDAFLRDQIQRGGAAQATSLKDVITNQFDAITYEQNEGMVMDYLRQQMLDRKKSRRSIINAGYKPKLQTTAEATYMQSYLNVLGSSMHKKVAFSTHWVVLQGKNLYFMPRRSSSLHPEKKVLAMSTMCVLLAQPDYEKMGFTPDEFKHSFALLVPNDTHSRFRKYMKPRMLGKWNKEVQCIIFKADDSSIRSYWLEALEQARNTKIDLAPSLNTDALGIQLLKDQLAQKTVVHRNAVRGGRWQEANELRSVISIIRDEIDLRTRDAKKFVGEDGEHPTSTGTSTWNFRSATSPDAGLLQWDVHVSLQRWVTINAGTLGVPPGSNRSWQYHLRRHAEKQERDSERETQCFVRISKCVKIPNPKTATSAPTHSKAWKLLGNQNSPIHRKDSEKGAKTEQDEGGFTPIGTTTVEVLEPYVHYAAAINIELVALDLSCTILRFSVFTGPLGSDPKACVLVAQYDISATQLLVQPVGTSVDLLVDSNPGVLRVFLPRRRHLPLHTLWSMARTVQSYRFVDKEMKLLNVREECAAVHLAYLVPLQFLQLRKKEIAERLDRLMAKYWRWNEQCKWFSLAKRWPKWVLTQKNRLRALIKRYSSAIEELKQLYEHQFDCQTAKSLSPYLRRSVQKWDQTTLKFVALNCHLQRCSVFSDVSQEVVGEQYAVVTWGVPTDHDKVHKGNGLQSIIRQLQSMKEQLKEKNHKTSSLSKQLQVGIKVRRPPKYKTLMNQLGSCSSETNLLNKSPLAVRKKSMSESNIMTALEPVPATHLIGRHSMPDFPTPILPPNSQSFPDIGGRVPSPPHAKRYASIGPTVGPNALRMLKRWRRRSLERRKKLILAKVGDLKVPPKLPDQNKKPALLSRRRAKKRTPSHSEASKSVVAEPESTKASPSTTTVSPQNTEPKEQVAPLKHDRKRQNLHRSAVIEYYDRAVTVCTRDDPDAIGNKELLKISEECEFATQQRDALLQAREQLRLEFAIRSDVCFSQALTPMLTSYGYKIHELVSMVEAGQQAEADAQMQRLLSCGFLVLFKSFLTQMGKEKTMLEDFFTVIQWLKHTRIRLVCVDLDSPDFNTDSESVSSLPFPDIAGTENFPESASPSTRRAGKHMEIPPRIMLGRGLKKNRLTAPSKRSPKPRTMTELADSTIRERLWSEVPSSNTPMETSRRVTSYEQYIPKELEHYKQILRFSRKPVSPDEEMSATASSATDEDDKTPAVIDAPCEWDSYMEDGISWMREMDEFGQHMFVAEFAVSRKVFSMLSKELRSGALVRVVPLLFSQGINEQATMNQVAARIGINTEKLQAEVNQTGLKDLKAFHKQWTSEHTSWPPELANVLDLLEQKVAEEASETNEKRYEIIILATDIVRTMQGMCICNCKSGKDRTSMAVTLQQARFLCRHHSIPGDIRSYLDRSTVNITSLSLRGIQPLIEAKILKKKDIFHVVVQRGGSFYRSGTSVKLKGTPDFIDIPCTNSPIMFTGFDEDDVVVAVHRSRKGRLRSEVVLKAQTTIGSIRRHKREAVPEKIKLTMMFEDSKVFSKLDPEQGHHYSVGLAFTIDTKIRCFKRAGADMAGGPEVLAVANAMRKSGVRLANARQNIGEEKFAFNAIQRSCLPECYCPPSMIASKAQT